MTVGGNLSITYIISMAATAAFLTALSLSCAVAAIEQPIAYSEAKQSVESALWDRVTGEYCRSTLDAYESELRRGMLCNSIFNATLGFKLGNLPSNRRPHSLRLLGRDARGHPNFMSSGQQDWWLWINHARYLQRPGFFVDLAANDPFIRSNTFALERCLGWNGLCIEPIPNLHSKLRHERTCQLVPNCISKAQMAAEFWVTNYNMGGSSRIGDSSASKMQSKCK